MISSSWNIPRQQNSDSWALTEDGGNDVLFNILSGLSMYTVPTKYILFIRLFVLKKIHYIQTVMFLSRNFLCLFQKIVFP